MTKKNTISEKNVKEYLEKNLDFSRQPDIF